MEDRREKKRWRKEGEREVEKWKRGESDSSASYLA